jgi:hypothetical protein
MTSTQTAETRDLTDAQMREIDGGVLPGGCVDPKIQQLIDAMTGTTQP